MNARAILRLSCCLLPVLLARLAHAGTDAAAYLDAGVGARAMGMGGAYVSVADDPSAVYWNPAGIAAINRVGFLAMGQSVSDGAWDGRNACTPGQQFIAVVVPVKNIHVPVVSAETLTLGFGYLHSGIQDVSYTAVDSQGRITRDTFNDTENAYFISCGIPLRERDDRLYAGMTLKCLTQQFSKIAGASAAGYDADIGLLYSFSTLSFGIVIERGVSLTWDNGHTDTSPLTTTFGVSNQFALKKELSLLASFDIVQRQSQPVAASLGAELMYRDIFQARGLQLTGLYLRTGIDRYVIENRYDYRELMNKNINLNAGAGLALDLLGYGLRIDYVFGAYRLGDRNKFSIGIVF